MMRMAINARRSFLVMRPLGFPPLADSGPETGLVVGGNSEAQEDVSEEVSQGVDGGFGVENAMDAALLSAVLLPSPDVSRGVVGASCPLLPGMEGSGEDWTVK